MKLELRKFKKNFVQTIYLIINLEISNNNSKMVISNPNNFKIIIIIKSNNTQIFTNMKTK